MSCVNKSIRILISSWEKRVWMAGSCLLTLEGKWQRV